ncbi:MAG: ABC transporter permease [Clostridiales bacterium]|nr:ABC transporter permease [Clostridiales bacterium]
MDNLQYIFSFNIVLTTLRFAIPLTLAAVGATICERSGIINLGVEGMMLVGAFGGVLGTHLTGSPWLGVLFSIFCGGLIALLHAVLSIRYKTNQTVSGVGINILSVGLTVVLTRVVWGTDGISGSVTQLSTMSIPLLRNIPVLGALFEDQSPFLYLTLIIVFAAWFFMYRTKAGLRLRAIGDHPRAAATVGINVRVYRYVAVVVCGMLCGMAGAYLSIVQNNLFVNNMVAGRGFIALAANIFGGWNPLGSFLASLLFAFAQALRINLSLPIPDQFVQMVPYALTLLVLIGVGRKVKAPEASGELID